jgi:hypothetical protein
VSGTGDGPGMEQMARDIYSTGHGSSERRAVARAVDSWPSIGFRNSDHRSAPSRTGTRSMSKESVFEGRSDQGRVLHWGSSGAVTATVFREFSVIRRLEHYGSLRRCPAKPMITGDRLYMKSRRTHFKSHLRSLLSRTDRLHHASLTRHSRKSVQLYLPAGERWHTYVAK